MSDAATSQPGQVTGYGSKPYRTYVLLTLTLVYTLNFIDRILITVVGRPIIDEFQLSNFQFGLLTGFAFALLYTLLGIPIAIASERMNRVRIIGACVILWSVATVLCGFTVGFATLLAARVLVGIGEAGCTPPANSIISDYYKPSARATALGIYAMGVTAGGLLAQVFGGSLLVFFTWREAFIFVGAPGILVGILLLFTVKEPPRGYSEPAGSKKAQLVPIPKALSEIMTKPTFWIMSTGATIAAFSGYALIGFQPLYIQYVKGVSVSDTALLFMTPIAVAGTVGAFLGGYLTELASKKHPTAICWVPGIAHLICAPIYAGSFLIGGLIPMLILMMIGAALQYFYLGSQYNIAQTVVSVRVRATSVAILLFLVNLIGYGAGPPFFGLLADMFTSSYFSGLGMADVLDASCSLTQGTEDMIAACLEGKAFGIRWSNFAAASLFGVAGVFFLLSGLTIKKDAETVTGPVPAAAI